MSALAPPPSAGGAPSAAPTPFAMSGEACPLCGAPLHPEQAWCLRCGAAARTRLAASPNWKGPIGLLTVVIVLALGVLAASLVALTGSSGSSPPGTTTVTVPQATTGAAPGAATTPGATAPGATTTTPGAATTTPGAGTTTTTTTTPGAATTTAPTTRTR